MSIARAFAPATVANVGPGFDVLGFALEEPGDEVEARRVDRAGVTIAAVEGMDLPLDASKNTAGVAARAMLEAAGVEWGVELVVRKGILPASGIGSSAASAAAAVVAVQALLDAELPLSTRLAAAAEGERCATGAAHTDNVAPSLVGGLVFVHGERVVSLPTPPDLFCAVVHPHLEVSTREARAVLPEQVALADAVGQVRDCAALVAALGAGDFELLAACMSDRIAEPRRTLLTPCYDAVRSAALDAGALSCGLSGSGPSMFAFVRGSSQASSIADLMLAAVHMAGHDGDRYVSGLDAPGARVL